jgi:hypothetical protein
VIATNDDRLRVLRNTGHAPRRTVTIRLEGEPGNPTGAGARVTLRDATGRALTAEVSAGSGYLSQGTATLIVARPEAAPLTEIHVLWADGHETRLADGLDAPAITLKSR